MYIKIFFVAVCLNPFMNTIYIYIHIHEYQNIPFFTSLCPLYMCLTTVTLTSYLNTLTCMKYVECYTSYTFNMKLHFLFEFPENNGKKKCSLTHFFYFLNGVIIMTDVVIVIWSWSNCSFFVFAIFYTALSK